MLRRAKAHPGEFTYFATNKGGSGHTFGMMLIYQLTGGYENTSSGPMNPPSPQVRE